MEIRRGHVVAAFVTAMLFGLTLQDPQMAAAHPGFGGMWSMVFWGGCFGILIWECIIRLLRLLAGRPLL